MKVKANITALIICISISTIKIYKHQYKLKLESEQLTRKILNSEYNPRKMIEVKIKEYKEQEKKEEEIKLKIKEITNFKSSEKYKIREETRSWREPLGISVDQIKKVTFKATAYSSLPEENGGYNVTCNGEPLEGNIVANNTLPQYSKIMLGNKMYTVADRGSSRFNNPTRLDVLIERKEGESIKEYRKRVSDYGVRYIEGYIIKEE